MAPHVSAWPLAARSRRPSGGGAITARLRCRDVQVHRDTLRNKLFTTHAAQQSTSAEQLHRMIMNVNDRLKARPTGAWAERVRGKPLEKARAHEFFLGLDEYAWLEMLGQAVGSGQ